MYKIKKILIATDLSSLSFHALEKGLEIAKKCHASVTILHILEKGFFDELKNHVLSQAQHSLIKSHEYAEQLIKEKIKKSTSKIKIDIKILSTKNKPSIQMIKYANKHQIDLMILGAHGQYSFRDWFVGTTAEYIVKKTSCPVLIIKNKKTISYKKILIPIDFSGASKSAVKLGSELFPKSHYYLLNVGDLAYEELAKSKQHIKGGNEIRVLKEIKQLLMHKLKQFISNLTLKNNYSFKVKIGYAGLTILQEAKKANLVIMGTQGNHRRYYKWLGSVANRVLIEIDKDILLVPPKNQLN